MRSGPANQWRYPTIRGRIKAGAKLHLRRRILDIPFNAAGIVTTKVGVHEHLIELRFGDRRVCFTRSELLRP